MAFDDGAVQIDRHRRQKNTCLHKLKTQRSRRAKRFSYRCIEVHDQLPTE